MGTPAAGQSRRVEQYMERHKIGSLMDKVLSAVMRDLPQDPIPYIIALIKAHGDKSKPASLTGRPPSVATTGARARSRPKTAPQSETPTLAPSAKKKGASSAPEWPMPSRDVQDPGALLARNLPEQEDDEAFLMRELDVRSYKKHIDSYSETSPCDTHCKSSRISTNMMKAEKANARKQAMLKEEPKIEHPVPEVDSDSDDGVCLQEDYSDLGGIKVKTKSSTKRRVLISSEAFGANAEHATPIGAKSEESGSSSKLCSRCSTIISQVRPGTGELSTRAARLTPQSSTERLGDEDEDLPTARWKFRPDDSDSDLSLVATPTSATLARKQQYFKPASAKKPPSGSPAKKSPAKSSNVRSVWIGAQLSSDEDADSGGF